MSSHRATSSASSGGESGLRPATGGQSHYQLLELSPQASATELRQAFRHLSKRYHPDTTTLPAAEAREAFARLRQAYAVLADPDSRRAYDAALQRPLPPLVVPPPLPTGPAAAPRPIGVRRSLSGGEWFALVLLGLALALSLVLGVGLAWARGAALITRPSWWSEASMPSSDGLSDAVPSGDAASGSAGSGVPVVAGAFAAGPVAAVAVFGDSVFGGPVTGVRPGADRAAGAALAAEPPLAPFSGEPARQPGIRQAPPIPPAS